MMKDEKFTETIYEKELQKLNKTKLGIEKVTRKEGGKLYVELKISDDSFNSWVDKKDIIWNILYKMRYYPKPDSHIENKRHVS